METNTFIRTSRAAKTEVDVGVPTLASPDISMIIHAMTLVMAHQIEEDSQKPAESDTNFDFSVFVEKKPKNVQNNGLNEYLKHDSEQGFNPQEITLFLKKLYRSANIGSECIILSFVYLNRFLTMTSCPLLPCNWKKLLVSATLIAQKVWNDVHLDNAGFSAVMGTYDVQELNELEEEFIHRIQFKVIVKMKVYIKFYFELSKLFPCRYETKIPRVREQTLEEIERRSYNFMNTMMKSHTIIL